MSDVFNTDPNQGVETNEPAASDLTGSYVAKLVQAKGDNWSNPEVMAKGKIEADAMIEDLQAQVEALRNGVAEQNYAKELIERLEKQGAAPTPAATPEPNPGGMKEEPTSLDPSDVENLVSDLLSKREKEGAINKNLNEVNAKMTETYGTEAGAEVSKRARELGMTVDQLQQIAGESPQAFFRLIGESSTHVSPVVKGTINTAGSTGPREKGWSYYRDLRKSDERLYRSAAIQNEIVAASQADPNFFKK